MGQFRTMVVIFLQGIATLFVLALPIGITIFLSGYVCAEYWGIRGSNVLSSLIIRLALKLVVWSYLLLPIGAFLDWTIAGATQFSRHWAWSTILMGSVILMFVDFPKGTISGGITLCLLYTVGTFRKMGKGARVFR